MNFLPFYFFNVFTRRHILCVMVIIRNSSTEGNTFQIQFFAQFLAVIIQTPSEPQSAEFFFDKNINPVKYISIRTMCFEGIISGNLFVGMQMLEFGRIHNNGKCNSRNLLVDFNSNLSFRKLIDQRFDLFSCPVRICQTCIGFDHGFLQCLVVCNV
ncbi:hypothetical protein D3C85_1388420 [compost metagenome]